MIETGQTEHTRKERRRWVIFALCSLLFISSQFYRVSNAIIAPQLQADFSITSEQLGLLSAAFFYAFAFAQIPLALLLDRLGARIIMAALSMVGAMGAWAFAGAQGLGVGVVGRMLLGLGMAGNLMGSLKLFTEWFPPRQFATLSGVLLAAGTIGNMVAATPLALLMDAIGWRYSFVIIGCTTAFLSALFFFVVRDRQAQIALSHRKKTEVYSLSKMIGLLLSLREYWLISLGTFFRYGVFVAIQGLWAGPYLMNGLGFSPVEAGNILLMLNIGLVVGSPLGGWLSDRILNSRKMAVILGLSVMSLSLFCLSMGFFRDKALILGIVFFFFGLSSGFGIIMYAHIKEWVPAGMQGMALTGVNLFTMLGAALFMQGMGWVLDQWKAGTLAGPGDYQKAFFIGLIGMVIALGLYFLTREREAEDTL